VILVKTRSLKASSGVEERFKSRPHCFKDARISSESAADGLIRLCRDSFFQQALDISADFQTAA